MSAICPEQPGPDRSIREVEAGVALVDPENPDAWLRAAEWYEVGCERSLSGSRRVYGVDPSPRETAGPGVLVER